MGAPPFRPLASALTGAALRAGRSRAIALYSGILLVSIIVFGGSNAMRASDVTTLCRTSLPARALLWAAWLAATAPLSRAILVMPATFALRALPVPRGQQLAVHALHLGVTQAPWLLLWGRGEGPGSGLAMLATAVGAEALLVARSSRWPALGAAAALCALLVAGVTGAAALPVAAAAALVGLAEAWRRAPELSVARGGVGLPGPRRWALAQALLLGLWRMERALLVRALLVAAIGVAASCAAILNNGVRDPASVARVMLAVTAPPFAIAGMASAGAVVARTRRERWLLDALGVGRVHDAGSQLAAAALWPLGLGATAGLVVARVVGASATDAAVLVGAGATWALALAAAALVVARRAATRGRDASARSVVPAMALLAIVASLGAALAGVAAAPLGAALTVAAALGGDRAREPGPSATALPSAASDAIEVR